MEQAVVAGYLAGEPYRNNWRRLGFGDDDFVDGGSDGLVDALVTIGEDRIGERVNAHLAAGADHVCLQALPSDLRTLPSHQWRRLAFLAGEGKGHSFA